MNEADTRVEHIDPTLKAGWDVVDGSCVSWESQIKLLAIAFLARAKSA